MRRFAHAIAIWLLSVSLAAAQTGVGQIANGNLLANATGSTAAARDTTPTAWFDQAYCNTIGNIIVRLTGAWTCSQASPANPVWWGADPTGSADSAPAFTSALAATPNILFPVGTFKFSSQISVSLAAGVHSLKIACAGQDNTVLTWTSTNGIVVTYADATNNSTHIDGCTFATGAANTSAGLTLQFLGTNTNPANTAQNTIFRSTFRGSDGYAATNLWNIAIKIVSVSNININGVNIIGGNVSTGYANTTTSGTGLSILGTALANAVAINVASSIFDYLSSGIIYGLGVQGVTVLTSNFTGGSQGIVVTGGATGADQLTIIANQFNDAVAAIVSNFAVPNTMIADNFIIVPVANGFGTVLTAYAETAVHGNMIQCATATNTNGLVFTTSATVAPSTVVGNVIYGCAVAVLIGAAAGQLVVANNNFNGDTLSNSGAGNVISGNLGYNPVGYTAGTSTGTTGTVISAGASPETHYITQSANFNAVVAKCTNLACGTSTNLCTVPSATVPCVLQLGPNENYKVTFTVTQPTYTKDIH